MRAAGLIVVAMLIGRVVMAQMGVATAEPAKGKQVYSLYCMTCHGNAGDGRGPLAPTLNPPPRDFTVADFKYGGTDQDLFDVISNGAAAKGGSPLMAPWGAVIPEADRWALVSYIRTLEK
jgi:mono/diheme cytochrome c family protein